MSAIRRELINDAINKAYALDYNTRHEFRQKTILSDKSLTEDEKTEAISLLNQRHERYKFSGKKRICENCHLECLTTLHCERCIRNYLKSKFSNWTSGNDNIDKLIQKCQMEILGPDLIVEWIPYNRLKNIKYLIKGECSEIYTADWVDGFYNKWDPKEQQLKRFGSHQVVLKELENVENANRSWFNEVCNLIIKTFI